MMSARSLRIVAAAGTAVMAALLVPEPAIVTGSPARQDRRTSSATSAAGSASSSTIRARVGSSAIMSSVTHGAASRSSGK